MSPALQPNFNTLLHLLETHQKSKRCSKVLTFDSGLGLSPTCKCFNFIISFYKSEGSSLPCVLAVSLKSAIAESLLKSLNKQHTSSLSLHVFPSLWTSTSSSTFLASLHLSQSLHVLHRNTCVFGETASLQRQNAPVAGVVGVGVRQVGVREEVRESFEGDGRGGRPVGRGAR